MDGQALRMLRTHGPGLGGAVIARAIVIHDDGLGGLRQHAGQQGAGALGWDALGAAVKDQPPADLSDQDPYRVALALPGRLDARLAATQRPGGAQRAPLLGASQTAAGCPAVGPPAGWPARAPLLKSYSHHWQARPDGSPRLRVPSGRSRPRAGAPGCQCQSTRLPCAGSSAGPAADVGAIVAQGQH